MVNTNRATDAPDATAATSIDTCDEAAFHAQLAAAIAASGEGHAGALIDLNLVREDDIEHCFGAAAASAITEHALQTLARFAPAGTPILDAGHCNLRILLKDTDRDTAAQSAHAFRDVLARTTFHWHNHPLRLGSYTAVLELGPEPVSTQAWFEVAREVSACALEMGGDGVVLLKYSDQDKARLSGERQWHEHLREVVA